MSQWDIYRTDSIMNESFVEWFQSAILEKQVCMSTGRGYFGVLNHTEKNCFLLGKWQWHIISD